jgi:hypothetical protein
VGGRSGLRRRVPKTERAEDAGAGTGLRVRTAVARMASARPTATSQPEDARGHHTQRRFSSERIRSARTGAILRNHILRNHRDSFGSPDTSVSTTTLRCRFGGEFDPGSGSTLAACLMHASRARTLSGVLRGGRVRNTWATCPGVGDSRGKPRVIPHTLLLQPGGARKGAIPPLEGPAAD